MPTTDGPTHSLNNPQEETLAGHLLQTVMGVVIFLLLYFFREIRKRNGNDLQHIDQQTVHFSLKGLKLFFQKKNLPLSPQSYQFRLATVLHMSVHKDRLVCVFPLCVRFATKYKLYSIFLRAFAAKACTAVRVVLVWMVV